MAASTAETLTEIMKGVVLPGGSGVLAAIRGVEVAGADDVAAVRVADDDAAEPPLEVGARLREGEDGHHLRGGRDDEARLARDAVDAPAQPHDGLP